MKRIILTILVAFALVNPSPQSWAWQQSKIEVYFSPQGGCTEAVVRDLDQATNNVLVQAYSFTSAPIAKALVDADTAIVVEIDKATSENQTYVFKFGNKWRSLII
jgi:hypothetical protein